MRLSVPLLLPAVVGLLACNDPPSGPSPAQLVIVRSPSTVGAPGLALVDTAIVRVQDASSQKARKGVEVHWVVTQGLGSVEVIDSVTNDEGLAAAIWTLGPSAGANRLRVDGPDGDSVAFEATGGAFRVDRVEAGRGLACGLVGSALWCWGDGFWGATPAVSTQTFFGWVERSSPGLFDDTHHFSDFAVTFWSVCGLDNGAVWCADQLDHNLRQVAGLPPLRRLVAAPTNVFDCGLAVSDSTAWCWQLGHTPGQVPQSPHFTDIRMDFGIGGITGCGLKTDSTVACWGMGPLGDGTEDDSESPREVSGGHHFAEVAVGSRFACARKASMEVWCWGREYDSDGNITTVTSPTLAISGAHSIAAADREVRARTPAGLVTWYGAGVETTPEVTGLSGLPLSNARSTSAICYLLLDGQVYCYDEMWDNSSVSRLDSFSPVQPVPSAARAQPALQLAGER